MNDGILLLGGGGFIGTALTKRLIELKKNVHIITSKPLSNTIPDITIHIGSLGDSALLDKLRSECSTIIHLATKSTPGKSARHPLFELENLTPTLQLLENLHEWKDTHLIFISSGGTVYGNPSHNPVYEDAPLAPRSYHGAGKVAIEGFLHAFRVKGYPVTILRPSNIYGPEQNMTTGFGFIRTVLHHALHNTAVNVWGDGLNIRDYIYIDDAINAITQSIYARQDSNTYNVGYGKGHTLNEVINIIQKICKKSLKIEHRPARSSDVREIVLDISKIKSALDWQPHTDLENGILKTWEWLKNS